MGQNYSEQDLRLQSVVAGTLGVADDEIDDDSSAKTLPMWNSYNHLAVMAAVEEAFGITFSMEEMTSIQNFGQLRHLTAAYILQQ